MCRTRRPQPASAGVLVSTGPDMSGFVSKTAESPNLRDSESVLSGYLSLSSSAPHLFGNRLDDFAGEVRALLANRSAEGTFWDWPGDTEIVMARKPG